MNRFDRRAAAWLAALLLSTLAAVGCGEESDDGACDDHEPFQCFFSCDFEPGAGSVLSTCVDGKSVCPEGTINPSDCEQQL